MQIRWHRGRVLMAVRRRNLPSAAADAAEPPPAFAEPWIAEATQAPLTGTVPSPDGADGSQSIEHGLRELTRSAAPGVAVRAPTKEAKAMSEAATIDVAAGDLAGHLRRHWPPYQVTLSRPSAIAGHATVDEARLATVSSQPFRRLRALRSWQHAAVADVVENAAGIVQAEDESRREARWILHVASHNAINRSQASHLDHEALAGTVREAAPLGDYALDSANAE